MFAFVVLAGHLALKRDLWAMLTAVMTTGDGDWPAFGAGDPRVILKPAIVLVSSCDMVKRWWGCWFAVEAVQSAVGRFAGG